MGGEETGMREGTPKLHTLTARGGIMLVVASLLLALAAGIAGGRSFPVSVTLVGLALACAVAACVLSGVGVAMARRAGARLGRTGMAACVLSALALVAGIAVGVPRGGRMFDPNPYANTEELQCVATFVVGREFAMPGTLVSDGYVIKVPEGTVVETPQVLPKAGLSFTGWRYGGTGDPDVEAGASIVLDANGTKNNSVILYAQFVDESGTAYCACGSTSDVLAGSQWQGEWGRRMLTGLAIGLALVAALAFLAYSRLEPDEEGEESLADEADAGDIAEAAEGDSSVDETAESDSPDGEGGAPDIPSGGQA